MKPTISIRRTHRGVTLIEVIVGVLVVSLLTALLLPSMKAMLRRGTAAKCVSNLKQVGIALFAYSADNQGRIPPRIEPKDGFPGQFVSGTYWHQILRKGGYYGAATQEVSLAEKLRAQMTGVHFCPEYPSTGTSEESYGMRRWKTPGQKIDVSQNLHALARPSDFFLLADSFQESTQRQYYALGDSTDKGIRFTHERRANTLFADGHVAAMDRAYFDAIRTSQAEYADSTNPYFYWPKEAQ